MNFPTLADVLQARRRIRPHLFPTPLEDSPPLGENIYLKLENLNKTHAFKIRGALNAMLALSAAERAKGVIACSAGNHSQGIAYAAKLAGTRAKVIMPQNTPVRKVGGARRYGAEILMYGKTYDEAESYALKLKQENALPFISPYNNTEVIAGQGTIALELFEELPTLERVLIPTSGGGLAAGVALVCKIMNPNCEVIGVQSTQTPAMYNAFYDTTHPQGDTLADGLSGEIEEGAITFDLCKQYVDKILLVEEAAIAEAIRWMLRHHGWAIEGAAAVGIAAFLDGQVTADDRTTAIIISGGNIDYEVVQKLLK